MFILTLLFFSTVAFDHHDCPKGDKEMCQYMKKFNKVYQHSAEYLSKKEIVAKRTERIRTDSAVAFGRSTRFGSTSMSDRIFHPNKQLLSKRPVEGKHRLRLTSYELPDSLDLRDQMQPVKDQGDCGSCYTFAAVAVLEFHAGVSISEQKLMDCSSSTNGPSYGCDGGWPETLFEYAQLSPVVLEKDQPYTGVNAPCNQTCEGSAIRVRKFGTIDIETDVDSELRIPYILNTYGPVVVAIDVGTTELLMSYDGGFFPGVACGTALDHAVTIVGYTEEYWIVRNSWGVDWGENGYFYLERGVNACGVADALGYISHIY